MSATRRVFLRRAAGLTAGAAAAGVWGGRNVLHAASLRTDVRVERVTCGYDEYRYRVPMKFAGEVMDRASLLTVHCTVRTADGQSGEGFGVIPFNHIFSYPSARLSHEEKNGAMKALAAELAKITGAFPEYGHPLELNWALAPLYFRAAEEVSTRLALADPIPRLCTLVTSSAFDAAIYDAFGKLHGRNSFQTLGPEFMARDLAFYLGEGFRGRYPRDYLLAVPKPRLPMSHLISAIDPIEPAPGPAAPREKFPETLPEWIAHNGLIEFKIKLNGTDLQWDLERALLIERVTAETQARRGVKEWAYVFDFNEKCPHVDYYLEFLHRLKERSPACFARLRYVEQPTARDLRAHPENRMDEAAKLCPVVIDESLTDVTSLHTARELGWTGAVVKSPKGLSNMLLIACVAGQEKILLAGGDMSCPGAALVQTAGFQARIPTITAIEANARQYLPQANEGWEEKLPGLFRVREGWVDSSQLTGLGLGA